MSNADSERWCGYANAPCADSEQYCSDGQRCMRRTYERVQDKILEKDSRIRYENLDDTVDYIYIIDGHRLGPGEQN